METREVFQWEWQDLYSFTPTSRRCVKVTRPGQTEGRRYFAIVVEPGEEVCVVADPEERKHNVNTLFIAPLNCQFAEVQGAPLVTYRCSPTSR